MGKSVTHYTDGRIAWKVGIFGSLVRIKGIVSSATLTLITMGSPWWWPGTIKSTISVDLKYAVLLVVLVLGGGFTFSLLHLRKWTLRSLDSKYYLHQLAHDIRDKQTALHKKLSSNNRSSKKKLSEELEALLSQICENTSAHFKYLTGDESICAAIRLASLSNDKKSVVYKTYARSKGLNSLRENHTESIPIHKGIPRFLRNDKNAQGILFYNDLKGAENDGTYTPTENDKLYSEEISTMMVAPLNAWSGIQQDMIGIMYITSRKSNTFKAKHVDSFGLISDLTASAIANTMYIVSLNNEKS